MASKISLRCKSQKGQAILQGLTSESTVQQLKAKLAEASGIQAAHLKIRSGFPPKLIPLDHNAQNLSDLPIKSGDTLIVEEDTAAKVAREDKFLNNFQAQMQQNMGILMRKVVPADNSCLFTSVAFVLHDGNPEPKSAPFMRQKIAKAVSDDPVTYNEAFLGRKNDSYCAYILSDDTWGGAIELSIFSKLLQLEIDVVDTQTGRIDRFGEDKFYRTRVLLIYDGTHYDPLMMESIDASQPPQTRFPITNDVVLSQAMEIAAEAKASRNYTDTSKFTLKCSACEIGLVGQNEATEHAQLTGHTNFCEY
ncbi:ubiquitin thioesterase OTU1 [Lingula anatina]|uniref:Ubiquitin thioesterase OTU n=1 Tax=Lingula anatina TaxID=7574 RepID=A0A1S3IRD5_LINAN|nr:ubiquitin thioesterase OTU1 [Lingula anatina]|eukprot:XP_013400633.1 ubiquitin thioesterase OTU1 [Lingula anatina]